MGKAGLTGFHCLSPIGRGGRGLSDCPALSSLSCASLLFSPSHASSLLWKGTETQGRRRMPLHRCQEWQQVSAWTLGMGGWEERGWKSMGEGGESLRNPGAVHVYAHNPPAKHTLFAALHPPELTLGQLGKCYLPFTAGGCTRRCSAYGLG